jgi:putative transposase
VAELLARVHAPPPADVRHQQGWCRTRPLFNSTTHPRFRGALPLFLQRLFILCFIELGSRRVHLAGCTASPDAAWVTQQARQFSWHLLEREPGSVRFLIHDRDGKFAAGFDTVFASEGIEVIKTPAQAPNANAVAERVIRSIREESLGRLLILNQGHLRFVLAQYLHYYNHRRPHQGLGQRPPVPTTSPPTSPAAPGRVRCRPVLGGLIRDYDLAA